MKMRILFALLIVFLVSLTGCEKWKESRLTYAGEAGIDPGLDAAVAASEAYLASLQATTVSTASSSKTSSFVSDADWDLYRDTDSYGDYTNFYGISKNIVGTFTVSSSLGKDVMLLFDYDTEGYITLLLREEGKKVDLSTSKQSKEYRLAFTSKTGLKATVDKTVETVNGVYRAFTITDKSIIQFLKQTTGIISLRIYNSLCSYEFEIDLDGFLHAVYKAYGLDLGPAGGIVFYDCDADNESGNADGLISSECGWRYLEVAPYDLRVVNGSPTVDFSLLGYSDAEVGYAFGIYDSGYVNGTETVIGSGEQNTNLLSNAMGEKANLGYGNYGNNYAARLCNRLEYKGYDDWFLPSRDELNLIYNRLYKNGLGNLDSSSYWSSSEIYGEYAGYYYARFQDFSTGEYGEYTWLYHSYWERTPGRAAKYRVRPIRAFSDI